MKHILLVAGLALSGCTTAQLAKPVPVAATTDAQTALNAYSAALGLAQVAVANNPALTARLQSLQAQAAPYVAALQTGVTEAQTAPSLAALAAELLVEFSGGVHVVPNT